jgi:hypothetical protein
MVSINTPCWGWLNDVIVDPIAVGVNFFDPTFNHCSIKVTRARYYLIQIIQVAMMNFKAYWASDAQSPDYRHLNTPRVDDIFTFTGAVLSTLCQSNRFDAAGGQDEVLFGLRGCRVVEAPGGFTGSAKLSEDIPDHNDFHCILGVWKRSTGEIAVFSGSTVPNEVYMQEQVTKGGRTANLLPTGCYSYQVGTHRGASSTVKGALREVGNFVVLRSNDDLVYTITDTWDNCLPGDNIHPAFLDQNSGYPRFSSAGCQTIPGNYDEAKNQHSSAWALFRQAAGLSAGSPASEDGRPFVYVLLTGREARMAAAGYGPADLARLRFGSRGADVEALQLGLQNAGALTGQITSVMDPGTVADYIRWQQANDGGRADGIVTPQAARALGFDLLAGQP